MTKFLSERGIRTENLEVLSCFSSSVLDKCVRGRNSDRHVTIDISISAGVNTGGQFFRGSL